ncbi:hypothetical protein [Streptomyces sp. 8L]|uniref:hypothetical protein n=1 Tax=Streptomyces sp. 8L TaxID=2877242 RepID=UPI001CD2D53E|nr:hypothetical protein [Streptomyces sp. 8L]MCA1220289.1 hypothetical protein [Streptomyces sp. 8L]
MTTYSVPVSRRWTTTSSLTSPTALRRTGNAVTADSRPRPPPTGVTPSVHTAAAGFTTRSTPVKGAAVRTGAASSIWRAVTAGVTGGP